MIEIRRHLEDTDYERTTLASRDSEHTTKAATKHTSQPASKPSTPLSTIPNDRKTLIHPIDEKAFEPHSAHRENIECIQKAYSSQAIKSFKAAPQYLKDIWHPLEENIVRRIFTKKGAKLLTYHLREVRVGLADENKTKPHWIADDVLDDLVRIWESEDFKKLSKKNKSNRNSNSGGLGTSLHSCSSIHMTEHCRRLHYFPEASKKSKSHAGASSSNAALMAEIQEMREENKMFREEKKCIQEELQKMGAIFAQLSANPEFFSSLNLNNSSSPNDETQAPCDED
nr:putative transposase En/Spm [Ipomoea batatas]